MTKSVKTKDVHAYLSLDTSASIGDSVTCSARHVSQSPLQLMFAECCEVEKIRQR